MSTHGSFPARRSNRRFSKKLYKYFTFNMSISTIQIIGNYFTFTFVKHLPSQKLLKIHFEKQASSHVSLLRFAL